MYEHMIEFEQKILDMVINTVRRKMMKSIQFDSILFDKFDKTAVSETSYSFTILNGSDILRKIFFDKICNKKY